MLRSILLASTLVTGLAGCAQAEGGPRMIGGGPDAYVAYDAPSQNVVGGGYARITGEADNRTVAYVGTPQSQAANGLVAEITGEANSRTVTYRNPTPAPTGLASVHSSQSGS